MEGFLFRSAVALLLSSAIAGRAFQRKSLDRSGALSGFLVMAIHLACSFRFGALLLVFFFTSSMLTKLGEEQKRSIDEDFKNGGQRNWVQVLANSALAAILVVIVAVHTGGQDRCLNTKESTLLTSLIGGVIGHYACCNGDTWSSEIGVLSNAQPRLITTLKSSKSPILSLSSMELIVGLISIIFSSIKDCESSSIEKVRKGTNGAVSLQGLVAAAVAGSVIGLTSVMFSWLTISCPADVAWRQLLVVPIATAAGLGGSLIDSLLGATLQFSGYCTLRKKVVGRRTPTVVRISGIELLDNNAVNAVSVLLTTLLTGLACAYTF